MIDWEDIAKTINFGKKDKPDKYGFTKKMHAIWDLVEAEKDIEDADFEMNEDDIVFFDDYKTRYERTKKADGKPYHYPRYTME